MSSAENSSKNYPWSVAVESGPADKVWMRILAERAGDDGGGSGEGRGVGCVLEGMELENISCWLSHLI